MRRLSSGAWLLVIASLLTASRGMAGSVLQDGAQTTPKEDPPEFREQAGVKPASGVIRFTFENAALQPAKYEIILHSDGTGRFVSHVGSAPPDDIANLPAQGQERTIQVDEATRARMFVIAAKEHFFAVKCESNSAKVAFQGKKTLAYEGPEGQGSCTFNYTPDSKLEWLSNQMVGLAATLEAGRRLVVEHEHGRLALDAELETLTTMVGEGQATEVQNIAPVLQGIIADDAVMVRARRRAQVLLDQSGAPAAH